MNAIKLEFDIGTTDAEAKLGVRVMLNNVLLYDNSHVSETHHFSHDLEDQDGEHELAIELYGKLPDHTKIDSDGNIVKDAMLTVENFRIDDIDISSMLTCYSNRLHDGVPVHIIQYHHDFNGTKPALVDQFHGSMGCNGTVTLKFATPIYLWLLENM
jgi:hypothetical protein